MLNSYITPTLLWSHSFGYVWLSTWTSRREDLIVQQNKKGMWLMWKIYPWTQAEFSGTLHFEQSQPPARVLHVVGRFNCTIRRSRYKLPQWFHCGAKNRSPISPFLLFRVVSCWIILNSQTPHSEHHLSDVTVPNTSWYELINCVIQSI